MAILKAYKVNSYRRICDVCGRPRQIEDIRFADNVAICSIHPTYRTAQQLNQLNARVRPPRILPVPQPKPLAPVDTYTAEEAQIFNFVTKWAPFDLVNMTVGPGDLSAPTTGKTAEAAAWTLIYMTALLAENKRPSAWLTRAKALAVSMGDTLLARQAASLAIQPWLLGAVEESFNLSSQLYRADSAALVIAGLCRLYSLYGDPRYLAGAKDAASFITFLQSASVNTLTGGTFADLGPPQGAWTENGQTFTADGYGPTSLLAVWALTLLKGITGDITIGVSGSPPALSAPSARLISTAITQIRSFWTVGYGGVNGFSAATPFARFDSAALSWNGTSIQSADWAQALFALVETEGISAKVLEILGYLQTIAPGGTLDPTSRFDPTLAAPTSFSATTHGLDDRFYEWATVGLLAKLRSTQDRAGFKTAKDTLAVPRARFNEATPRSGDYVYLGVLGRSRFDLTATTSTTRISRVASVSRAAQVALAYRQQPQGFTGQGHAV